MCENRARRICRHCGKNFANRPRGLCWSCYYSPGVREQYASAHKVGTGLDHRGFDCVGNGALPEPTDAIPGSEAKIQVLERRAALGQSLFHPLDKRDEATHNEPRACEREETLSIRTARILKVHIRTPASMSGLVLMRSGGVAG